MRSTSKYGCRPNVNGSVFPFQSWKQIVGTHASNYISRWIQYHPSVGASAITFRRWIQYHPSVGASAITLLRCIQYHPSVGASAISFLRLTQYHPNVGASAITFLRWMPSHPRASVHSSLRRAALKAYCQFQRVSAYLSP